MLQLTVFAPTEQSPAVREILENAPAVSALAVMTASSIQPAGDLYSADLAREAANEIVDRLIATGVHKQGTISLNPVANWISQPAFDAEVMAPGAAADAVVWSDVVQEAYTESTVTWSYLSFMILATLLAAIAIVLDSQILVIAAMVLGPEFGAVAALGIALIRRRFHLLRRAAVALVIGYACAIGVTALAALLGRAIGWVTLQDVTAARPGTAFIYSPDKWSLLVAVIAGAAGVLAITSERSGGLVGVFISVTTIPAAGNIALGIAFLQVDEIVGSSVQLVVNLLGMAVAGWATLFVQQRVWRRMARKRADVPRSSGHSWWVVR